MAGFGAVIVEGRAEKPAYLFIKDGEASLKDAGHLWGMKALECQIAIREELADLNYQGCPDWARRGKPDAFSQRHE